MVKFEQNNMTGKQVFFCLECVRCDAESKKVFRDEVTLRVPPIDPEVMIGQY